MKADEGVLEWGPPGLPRVQLNSTFAVPPLVVKFSVASPPNNQNCMNSLTDASRNWKFDLDIFFKQSLPETGLPCESELSCYLCMPGVHL